VNKYWTFQLLLEVFCSEIDNYHSPIIMNTFVRDEVALIDYPFDFSIYHPESSIRFYTTGRFNEFKCNNEYMIKFITDVFPTEPLAHTLIEAIISRDKLIKT